MREEFAVSPGGPSFGSPELAGSPVEEVLCTSFWFPCNGYERFGVKFVASSSRRGGRGNRGKAGMIPQVQQYGGGARENCFAFHGFPTLGHTHRGLETRNSMLQKPVTRVFSHASWHIRLSWIQDLIPVIHRPFSNYLMPSQLAPFCTHRYVSIRVTFSRERTDSSGSSACLQDDQMYPAF